MALTNAYASLPEFKTAVGISDSGDDSDAESAIASASRQIDAHCGPGRKFWQDTTVVARSYYPSTPRMCLVDDVSTLTGLIVKVDTGDDGTFATTLSINTDFIVRPVNAAAEYPAQPWTQILLLDNPAATFDRFASGRPNVQVTAKFGWPAIPDDVKRACIVQAKNVFKAQDATFGSFQLSVDGLPQRVPPLDPTARALLEDFIRYDEVDSA